MSRSAAHYAPPCELPRTPHVHPAVAELVARPVVQSADGVELLRPTARPRTTHALVFDTETTGREHDARIVELAIAKVCLVTGEIVTARTALVNPGRPIPRDVSAVHGITDAMVRGCPDIGVVLTNALRMVAKSGLPMVAHNANFDLARIRFEAQRTDTKLPGTIPVHCSLEASRKLHRTVGHSLAVVAARYGVTVADAHRALGDVAMLAGVLPHLLRRPDAQGRDFRECFPLKGML
jgi:DNA polymerase III subunit epsilon